MSEAGKGVYTHIIHLIEFDLSTLIHFHSHWSLSQPRFWFYGGPTALLKIEAIWFSIQFSKLSDKPEPSTLTLTLTLTERQSLERIFKPFTIKMISDSVWNWLRNG